MMNPIPDGHPVYVDGEEHIEYIWNNNNIVIIKIDRTVYDKIQSNLFVKGSIAFTWIIIAALSIAMLVILYLAKYHYKYS